MRTDLELCDQSELPLEERPVMMTLIVADIRRSVSSSLKSLDVLQEMTGRHFSIAGLNGLLQCVVNEDILLFSLNQIISLLSNVFEETEHIDRLPVLYLALHCVQHNVSAGTADARTAVHYNWTASRRISCRRLANER